MKKKLFLSAVFVLTVCFTSIAQINSDFLKKEKNVSLINYSKELPEYTSMNYDIRLQSPSFEPSSYQVNMDNRMNSANSAWIGQSQQTTFNFYSVPVKTNYQFDVNGRLRSSSVSIKLNK